MSKSFFINTKGQAMVTVLVFAVVTITIATAAIFMTLNIASSQSSISSSSSVYLYAETGMENALLRLLRDPAYSGEVMQIGSAEITTSVTNGSDYTITSSARDGSYLRTIQVQASVTNGILSIDNWKEVE